MDHPLELSRTDTAVVIIDIQEKLAAAMPEEVLRSVSRNARILLGSARALGLPVVVTEQYPKGLGPTLPELADELPEDVKKLEKTELSAMGADSFVDHLRDLGVKSVLLVGMEAHVCVLQTAVDLTRAGYHVWVLADAVCSRTKANWRVGLALAEKAGAVVGSIETALFLLLGRAGTPEFKEISRLVR